MKELPKGMRLDHGYLQVRIMHQGRVYHKNFGPDSALARSLAEIHLSEKRKEILMGRFGIAKELPSKKFKEVAEIYYEKWSKELDPEGRIAHGGAKEVQRVIKANLVPYFGQYAYEEIKPKDVVKWREERLKTVLGTSVNREQAVLSSIFSHIERWVSTAALASFKLPTNLQTGTIENPTKSVEKARNRKRKRVLSVMELKALKQACLEAKDADLWEICEMALKSLLRKKDLFNLEMGIDIDTIQAKTQRSIHLPVSVLRPLRYANFRKRWEAVRKSARLVDTQFRDLRKTGANLLKMKNHSNKLISEFLGHASTRTTEVYMVEDISKLQPLADDLDSIIKGL